MHRHRTLVCLAAASAALTATAVARAGSNPVYPRRQVAYLIDRGVLHSRSPHAFHPEDPLAPHLLARMLAAIPGAQPVELERGRVTVHEVNTAFVAALGLYDVAAHVADGLRAAGLRPRQGAGLEVVARSLGLRHNYPPALDVRERRPSDPAIRIDGAFAAWKVLREQGWEQPYVRDTLGQLWIPEIPAQARGALRRAVAEIGTPYVWAGSSLADGGFDCSGLVLYALGGDEGWLGGRVTQDWARTHRKDRLSRDELRAGDIVLFGRRGPRSRPGQVDHTGLYLGNGWFVESANQGVTVASIGSDYYSWRFAFGLRPPV